MVCDRVEIKSGSGIVGEVVVARDCCCSAKGRQDNHFVVGKGIVNGNLRQCVGQRLVQGGVAGDIEEGGDGAD